MMLWELKLKFREKICKIKDHKWRQLGGGIGNAGFTIKSTSGTIYDGVMCVRCMEVKSVAEIEKEDTLKERERAFRKLL